MMKEKKIILGVTAGIAAYKAPSLVRALKKAGAQVQVIMTKDARKFVTPLTLEAVSGKPVFTDMFKSGSLISHVELAREASAVLIAPATADFLGKAAGGLADNLLLATLLVTTAPIVICPSMNSNMWSNFFVQQNVGRLRRGSIRIVPPEYGELACGDGGTGRLPGEDLIVQNLYLSLGNQSMKGKKVLITAGPTREYADPVRYVSNDSSGKMGFAFALAAAARGAEVVLVTGPTGLVLPTGAVKRIDVVSAREMNEVCLAEFFNTDIFVASAAVSDYQFRNRMAGKMKKEYNPTLTLEPNVDVLGKMAKIKRFGQIFVGFALETDRMEENAKKKFDEKSLDWVICNGSETVASDRISGFFWSRHGREEFDSMEKLELAEKVLDRIIR